MINKDVKKSSFFDASLWSLLATNLIAIALAYVEQWNLGAVMFIYWSQSVTIGVLWCIKINCLTEFSTKGVKFNDQPVEPTTGTKRKIGFFFLFHYGFFHFGYLLFIMASAAEGAFSGSLLLLVVSNAFAMQHVFSFFYNHKWRTAGRPNIGTMMMFPYARIVPMHLTIIFGGLLSGGEFQTTTPLILFMLLKTAADLVMHAVERRGFRDPN